MPRGNINNNARQIIKHAQEQGMSYAEVAEWCNVEVDVVRRWLITGRALDKQINPLIQQIGTPRLSAESVGEILMDIYNNRQNYKRFRLNKTQLKKISGRSSLRVSFVEELTSILLDKEYHIIDVDGDNELFLMISKAGLLKNIPEILDESEVEGYYQELAEEIDYIEEPT